MLLLRPGIDQDMQILPYDVKYGIRDYRGGGRSSARETAARVAAGGLARLVVPNMKIRGASCTNWRS